MGWLGVIGAIGGMATSLSLWDRQTIGFGVVIVDNFTVFFNITLCAIGLLTILISTGTAERDRLPTGEYYALVMFSLAGMMLMGSTRDLLVIFLALMLISWLSPVLRRMGFGRLPGDLRFRWLGRDWDVPLASTLLLSFVASLLAKWL